MSFDEALKAIKNQPFSKDKLNMAKNYIGGNYLQSAQMKEIIKIFSFPDERAEIAIFGYQFVCDPGNYFLVSEAMTFLGEKEKLNKYIAANQRVVQPPTQFGYPHVGPAPYPAPYPYQQGPPQPPGFPQAGAPPFYPSTNQFAFQGSFNTNPSVFPPQGGPGLFPLNVFCKKAL